MLADGLDQATGWTIKLDTITAMQGISGFLANNWSFAIPNGVNTNWVYAKVNPTNNNIWTPNILNQDYNWVPDQIMQATKTDGVPGQNVPNPLALFGNHQIIELDENVPGQPAQVILFDPSYGKKYTGATLNAALQKLQDGEIAAFVVAARWPLPINGQKVLELSISPNKTGAL